MIISTLTDTITADAVTLPITTGTGATFPQNQIFHILVEEEMMLCTGVTGDTLAVSRGHDGTIPSVHAVGEYVRLLVDDKHVYALNQYVDTLSGGNVDISGTPSANDIARFVDADTIEGRSYAELKSDLDLEINTDLLSYEAISVTGHYTGFPNRTDTSLSWSDANIKLTLTATADPVWINGVKYVINTLEKVLDDVTGLYWCWITAPGGVPQLNADVIHPGFDKCLVATVYWNTTIDKGIMCDERHWMGRDTWLHEYLHETVGARFYNGMAITPTSTTFSIDGGEFYDEDLEHVISGAKTTCRLLYKDGAATWKWDAGATNLYKLNGTAMRYNNGTALADCATGDHVAMWVFVTNDATYPYHVIIGQRVDTTVANARVNAVPSSLSFGNLPSAEMKLLYRVIFRQNASSVTYVETADYRAVSNLPVANYTATDHSALSNLSVGDDHPQYLLEADIDDTPVDGVTDAPISSNWAYDHLAAADPHGGYVLESLLTERGSIIYRNATTPAELKHGTDGQVLTTKGDGADPIWADVPAGSIPKLDDCGTPDNNTDLNATTTAHGLLLQATAPASGLYNYVGITNGETAYTNKALFDATAPENQAIADSAAAGTAAVAARRDHKHGMPSAATMNSASVQAVEDAGLVMTDTKNIEFETTPSASHTANGIIVTLTAGAALAFGDACYPGTDGKMEKALADDAAITIPATHLCIATISENAAGLFLERGYAHDDSWSFDVGKSVYLSAATAGLITKTMPTKATGNQVQVLGTCVEATDTIYWNPSPVVMEYA